eukprot:1621897-Rhodomonas_salina.7
MSGTDIAYGAQAYGRHRMPGLPYQPTRMLRDVRAYRAMVSAYACATDIAYRALVSSFACATQSPAESGIRGDEGGWYGHRAGSGPDMQCPVLT